MLENVHGLKVKIEKKSVELNDDMDEQMIVEQSIASGTEVKAGDEIILYIPDVYEEYPDFTDGTWSLSDIEAFCNEYELQLTVAYQETDDYSAGTIFRQSREPKSKIVRKASLKITVAKEMPIIQDTPTEDNNEDEEVNSDIETNTTTP